MEQMDNTQGQSDEYSQGSRNRKIFTRSEDIFGLPSSIFMGSAAAVFAVFLIFHWWTAVIAAVLIFPPMYSIHKDDPRAFAIWQYALTEKTNAWEAGSAGRRELVILSRDS